MFVASEIPGRLGPGLWSAQSLLTRGPKPDMESGPGLTNRTIAGDIKKPPIVHHQELPITDPSPTPIINPTLCRLPY